MLTARNTAAEAEFTLRDEQSRMNCVGQFWLDVHVNGRASTTNGNPDVDVTSLGRICRNRKSSVQRNIGTFAYASCT